MELPHHLFEKIISLTTIDTRRAFNLYGKIDRGFIDSFNTRYAKCATVWSTWNRPVHVRDHPYGDVAYHWIGRNAKLSSNKELVYLQRFNSGFHHDINEIHVFERTENGDLTWHFIDTRMNGKRLPSKNTKQRCVPIELAHAIIGSSELHV